MRWMFILALAFVAVGCGTAGQPTVASEAPPATSLRTTTVPATVTPAVGVIAVDMEVSDCTTPPVDFSLLCETYELIEEYHVDRPLSAEVLAAGATLGLQTHAPGEPDPSPESMRCAIPEPSFEPICGIIEERLERGDIDLDEAIEDAVVSMIEFSLDPFTYYIPPELAGEFSNDGFVSSVGLLLTIADPAGSVCRFLEEPCQLTVVFATGSGAEAGIAAGDVIVAVDERDLTGLTLIDVASELAGADGSQVPVTIQRDGDLLDLTVDRVEIPAPTVDSHLTETGVGYLKIPDFEEDIPGLVHNALAGLVEAGASSIVVDLRDNPGGFIASAVYIASEFLADGLVMRSAGDEELQYPVLEGGLATSDIPVTVVVNGGSASASEIVAGVLQERGRARIVGSPTFGKNTAQIGFGLRNDGVLRVTISRWTTPEGVSVAGSGIVPDDVIDIPSDSSIDELIGLVGG